MIETNYLAVAVPIFLMGILGMVTRCLQGGWFAPGPFFTLYWFLCTIIPLAVAPEYPVQASGVYWILFSCLAVSTGSLLGMGTYHRKTGQAIYSAPRRLNLPCLNHLVVFSAILGLMSPIYLLFSEGYLNLALFSPENIVSIARRFSVMRYGEGYSPPLLSRILNVFIYAGALLGGVRYITAKTRKDFFIAFTPLFPALMNTVILTTKASILFGVLLLAGSSTCIKIYMDKGKTNFYFFFKPLFYGALSLLPLMFVADILRGGKQDFIFGQVWEHLKPSFFGYLAVFTTWFETSWDRYITPQFGAQLLAGLFDMLGLHPRTQWFSSDNSTLEMLSSNVYTIFRGLISDFTLVGSLCMLFVFGIISGAAYRKVVYEHILFVPVLALFYCMTLWSFTASALNYNCILLAFILFLLYFCVMGVVRKGIKNNGLLSSSEVIALK